MPNISKVKLNDVTYTAVPGEGCSGCVAKNNKPLCNKLPPCSKKENGTSIIFKKSPSAETLDQKLIDAGWNGDSEPVQLVSLYKNKKGNVVAIQIWEPGTFVSKEVIWLS